MLYTVPYRSGATAIVKKYRNLNTGVEYAVKTINKKVSDCHMHAGSLCSRERLSPADVTELSTPLQEINPKILKREVDILLHLSHENIVSIINGTCYPTAIANIVVTIYSYSPLLAAQLYS